MRKIFDTRIFSHLKSAAVLSEWVNSIENDNGVYEKLKVSVEIS